MTNQHTVSMPQRLRLAKSRIEQKNLEVIKRNFAKYKAQCEYFKIGSVLCPILLGTHYSGMPHDSDLNPVHGHAALAKFIGLCNENMHILDVGCGPKQIQTKIMRANGLRVYTCDAQYQADYAGQFEEIDFQGHQFDALWSCHCLEHVRNQFNFFHKIKDVIKEGGVLAITVPVMRHFILSGHVNQYNEGQLLYNLVLAGFDCSRAMVGRYGPGHNGSNISVILRVKKIVPPPESELLHTLSHYFPFDAMDGLPGDNITIDWD